MVLNALDNLDARKHVNAMCLAANIPLIESGTTGYLGQSYVIKKGITECFDCHPKPTPTTYPVCTIRSTPSAPIHCIVWAKSYLFNQLFGNSEDDEAFEQEKSDENAQELEALSRETDALKKIKEAMGTSHYSQQVFDKVFKSDIERLLTMEDMWKNRKKPTPLDYEQLSKGREVELSNSSTSDDSNSKPFNGLQDQKVWTIGESFDVFRSSVTKLSERLQNLQAEKPDSILMFDKDDDDALQFVTSAANLRARIFNIQEKSLFEVKSMAGNIIPAIATTNAIIAGVVVMKAFDVLRGSIATIQRTYLATVSRQPRLLVQEQPSEPNPDCQVCQATGAVLKVNLEKATLRNMIEDVLLLSVDKGGAGLTEEIAIMDGERMLYDIEYDDNMDASFKDLNILDGTILRVGSEDGNEDLDIIIQTSSSLDHLVELSEPINKIKKEKRPKRPLEMDESESTQKKPKLDSVVEIEDDEDGVILLD
ncbi:unnamed protein product [Cunninghamella echinulata]